MARSIEIISNDDFYNEAPAAHDFAANSAFPQINEGNYPYVEAWEVQRDSNGVIGAIVAPIWREGYTPDDSADEQS